MFRHLALLRPCTRTLTLFNNTAPRLNQRWPVQARLSPNLLRHASKSAGPPLINSAIPHKTVCYVDENQKLSPPTPLDQLLATIDTSSASLVLVDATKQPPICRIVPKADLNKKSKESNKKAGAKQDKTVTLRWKVAPNDLLRKLDSAKKFLAKGHRVSIVFEGPYEGNKAAKEAAVQQVAAQLVQLAENDEIKIKEWQKPKFTFKESAVYYQPAKN